MEANEKKRAGLCIRNLSKKFQTARGASIPVLKNIDIELSLTKEDQKFIVFLGPSGCGKTTLLRIIAGLEEPSEGTITYQGEKPVRGWASVVFQEFSLFPWYSVRKNVEFGLKMKGLGKEERKKKAMSYLKKVGLTDFADAYPHQLSGGMKQRVAVARSLVVETPLLLMDEPFGSLDMITREKMYDFMWDVWNQTEITVIQVTHNVEEAILLGDTIHLLSPAPAQIVVTFESDFQPADRFKRNRDFEEMVRQVKTEILSISKETK